jgi:hypothetical protein
VRVQLSEQREAAELLLRVIRGSEPEGRIELRAFADGRFARREFHRDPPVAAHRAHVIAGCGLTVFVGAMARYPVADGQAPGGKAALRLGRLVWADCDSTAAVDALAVFPITPTFLIESGGVTPEGRAKVHAWWSLMGAPLAPDAIEHVNRRLARTLGADAQAVDASRVLRLPGVPYRKRELKALTVCVDLGDDVDRDELLRNAPEPPPPPPPRLVVRYFSDGDDVRELLRSIETCDYVSRLTGQRVEPGAIRCPLSDHEDRTPSFHVYEADRGWWCFGCSRGGDVFDLAAALWQLDRDREFPALLERLGELFGLTPTPTPAGARR